MNTRQIANKLGTLTSPIIHITANNSNENAPITLNQKLIAFITLFTYPHPPFLLQVHLSYLPLLMVLTHQTHSKKPS